MARPLILSTFTLLLAACGTMPIMPPEPPPGPEPEPTTYTVTNLVATPPTVLAGEYTGLNWEGDDPVGYLITNTIGLARNVGPFTSTFVYPRSTTTYRVAPRSNPRTGYDEVTVTVIGSPPDAAITPDDEAEPSD